VSSGRHRERHLYGDRDPVLETSKLPNSAGDRWFESISLQRRVNKLSVPLGSAPADRVSRLEPLHLSLSRSSPWPGTDGSNPPPSSRESANFRFLSRRALTCLSAAQHYRADAHHGSFPLSGSDIGLQIPLGFMLVRSFHAAADNLGKSETEPNGRLRQPARPSMREQSQFSGPRAGWNRSKRLNISRTSPGFSWCRSSALGLLPDRHCAGQHRERPEADRERPEHRHQALDFDH
jgi:hypothetical protein